MIQGAVKEINQMNRKYVCYSYTSKPVNPLVLILLAIFAVVAFFLTLPIFLAALTVFAGTALYMAWKFKRALREAAKQMEEAEKRNALDDASDVVIDVTDMNK